MQKSIITLYNPVIENGEVKKGTKQITVFAASSRGTNCILRDLAEQGEAVIKTDSTQVKVDEAATFNAVKTLAAGQFKNPTEAEAFTTYTIAVLKAANLFKVEKVNKA